MYSLPLVSANPHRLVAGPILLIFYHVLASTFHHYDWSMYVYGLNTRRVSLHNMNFEEKMHVV